MQQEAAMTATSTEVRTPVAAPPARRAVGRALRLPGLRSVSALYLLALVLVVFGTWVPETFLTRETFTLVLSDQVVVGILALALLVPLVCGAFDLSCGAMLGFSLVVVSWLQANTELGAPVSCVLALLACACAGWLSGLLTVRFGVNSFIATLGMSQVLTAATLYLSKNRQIVGVLSSDFQSWGRREVLGVPIVFCYLVVLALLVWYVLECTPLGRHMFATGANAEAARLSGVRTERMVWGSLVASAVIAGLAGLVFGAKVGSFSNSFGPPLLFPAFAAVFFGATQVKRRPNVWGAVLAVYTLAFGVKGLQLAFQDGVYWITPTFNGLALLVAVSLATKSIRPKLTRRPAHRAEAEPVHALDEP
jgi:ribose transport system permease protein